MKTTIGQRLHWLICNRPVNGHLLSGREVGRRAGVSGAYISNVISGRTEEPGVHKIKAIAKVFNCPPEWLAYGVGDVAGPRPLHWSDFHVRLKAAMDSQGLRPADIDQHFSNGYTSRLFERGTEPARDRVLELAKALNVNPIWLFMGEGPMTDRRVG